MRIAQSTSRYVVALSVLALVATVLLTTLTAGQVAAQQAVPITCYAIADEGAGTTTNGADTQDTLVRITDAFGAPTTTSIPSTEGLASSNTEALTIKPTADTTKTDFLWAWDGQGGQNLTGTQLGLILIDSVTGAITPAPFQIGGAKIEGLHWQTFNDTDETNDVLWAITNAGVVTAYNVNGGLVSGPTDVTTGVFDEGADIAVDPIDQTVYAVITNVSDASQIVVAQGVGGPGGGTVVDLEGLGFQYAIGDATVTMVGTTGNDGGQANNFFVVNRATGVATSVGSIADPTSDHEDVDCATPYFGDVVEPPAPPVTCYAIADEGVGTTTNGADTQDTLVRITDAFGAPATASIPSTEGLASSNTEALTIKPTIDPNKTDFLWAWDGQGGQNLTGTQFGLILIDSVTGAITPAPFQIGGAKIEGLHWQTFNDTDETNDVLWAINNAGVVTAYNVNGGLVFGPTAVTAGAFDEGADIAVDPIDQTVWAVITNVSDASQIVVVQGPGGPGGGTVVDLEGLGYAYTIGDATATRVGTTGNDGGQANNFYIVNDNGGIVLQGSIANPTSDHEDVDCVDPLIPTFGSIGDFMFSDINVDGSSAGEAGIAGEVVNLWTSDAAGNPTGAAPVDTTTTGTDGAYEFTNVPLGAYVVQFPAGLDYTTPNLGSDATDSDVDPATGISEPVILTFAVPNIDTVDAGVRPANTPVPVTIGNRVFLDRGLDGDQTTDPGVAGATVNLWNSDAAGNPTDTLPVATTTTAAAGLYQFTGLRPGTYVVQVIDPIGAGFTPAVNAVGDTIDSDVDAAGISDPITLTGLPGSIVDNTADAGLIPLVTIGNRVWIDTNSDGSQAGEPGLSGVTVNLWTSDAAGNPTGTAPVASTTTGAGGIYSFPGQPAGTYVVQVIDPTGAGFTTANAAGDTADNDFDAAGISDPVTLTGAVGSIVNNTIDAGILPTAGLVTIGNRVWVDTNSDGSQAGEPGYTGATVNLWTSDAAGNPTGGAPVATTTTGAAGLYQFTGQQPGTYVVQFIDPVGTGFTLVNAITDTIDSDADASGISDPVTLTGFPGSTVDNTIDAGLVAESIASLVTIGNRVWLDSNGDGSQVGEPGIPGVTANLWTSDAAGNPTGAAPVATTATGAGGVYQFTGQQPGTYVVQFIDPVGAGFTLVNAAADTIDSDADAAGITDPVTLTGLAGSIVDNTLDAGLASQLVGNLVTIGNRVWLDSDSDGNQTGETGIPAATVNLWTSDAAGNPTGAAPVATTTTGAGGIYQFTGQQPGTYVVQFIDPSGNGFTAANAAADISDSDADAAGISDPVTLTGAPGSVVDNTIDAGILPGGADYMVMPSVRCIAGNGVVTTTIINKTGTPLSYQLVYPEPGHPDAPGSVAGNDTVVINRGGRPDGPYTYTVTVNGTTTTYTVDIACD